MHIVADQQIAFAVDYFSGLGEVHLVDGRKISPDTVSQADILLVRSVTPVDSGLLTKSRVKFVASATSGIDHIDTGYLEKNGVGFAHAGGCNARSVAEYVLSCLLIWAEQREVNLLEKKMGIIGHGHIGRILHELLKIIGINCLINDPPLKIETKHDFYCDLDEVLSADILSLHVPYVSEGEYPTDNLVNRKFLDKVKDSVLLINTSRGEVIDESALIDFIGVNKGVSLVLDVWKNEPLININLLKEVCIGTPHIAGYSLDGKLNATRMLYIQACEFFGRDKSNVDVQTYSLTGTREFFPDINLDENELIKFAVLSHYDARSDGAALKMMLDLDNSQRGIYFDQLRKNYPVRREFPATRIHLNPNQSGIAEKLQALGFMVSVT